MTAAGELLAQEFAKIPVRAEVVEDGTAVHVVVKPLPDEVSTTVWMPQESFGTGYVWTWGTDDDEMYAGANDKPADVVALVLRSLRDCRNCSPSAYGGYINHARDDRCKAARR